ncbi:hypothetical protein CEXT_264991 [Caerostris extrusa]|uniref:Uncharacterized protein n=1 Tax=Caerostris extrusa TaxID=172846 RepID=A0AAV4NYV9_CAEEX|nr:hypothetical protein CEXT_264991 [Caerostris extrusa]
MIFLHEYESFQRNSIKPTRIKNPTVHPHFILFHHPHLKEISPTISLHGHRHLINKPLRVPETLRIHPSATRGGLFPWPSTPTPSTRKMNTRNRGHYAHPSLRSGGPRKSKSHKSQTLVGWEAGELKPHLSGCFFFFLQLLGRVLLKKVVTCRLSVSRTRGHFFSAVSGERVWFSSSSFITLGVRGLE